MYADLLTQAETLATLDPGRPKQANLRRAVSSTYYGLFHFLVDQSCKCAMGRGHRQQSYRRVLARAFDHAAMKHAYASFSGGVLKKGVAEALPTGFHVDDKTRRIAELFVDLQERRHAADYDLSRQFARTEVSLLIDRARKAIDYFHPVHADDGKKFFLACLWAYARLANRG